MGLVDDMLKGLPVNPLLREKITELEAKYAAADTENAILKDDIREAKAEIAKLKIQIEGFTHKEPDLNETEVSILKVFTRTTGPVEDEVIASHCGLNFQVAKFHLQRLEKSDYVGSYQGFYSLSYKGREYLIMNNLI